MKIMAPCFVSHNAPTLLLDKARGEEFTRWGEALGKPEAILGLSANWLTKEPTLGTLKGGKVVHDFYGFPREIYEKQYPAPGAPLLAEEVDKLLAPRRGKVARAPARGYDHGLWIPLYHLYPKADIPLLQLSLPLNGGGEDFLELGKALAPLSRQGYLILCSGAITHNLGAVDFQDKGPPPSWAVEFDRWCEERLLEGKEEELLHFREKAPHGKRAHPGTEHFFPLLTALGAAREIGGAISFPIKGFELGSLSKRCVQFG